MADTTKHLQWPQTILCERDCHHQWKHELKIWWTNTQRLQEMDHKVSETTKLAEDNKRQVDYLAQERDSLSTKGTGQKDITTRRTNWGPDKQEYPPVVP